VVVDSPVSLRDIAATIAGFVRPGPESPFPGRSLLQDGRTGATPPDADAGLPSDADDAIMLSELASPNPSDPNGGRSPAHRGPLISLAEGHLVYIRNERDGGEELFNEREDPLENNNLAGDGSMAPALRRFRDRLGRTKALARVAGDAGAAPRVASTRNFP
jgi:hypothetical protein